MKKSRGIRWIALCLAVVLLVSVVGALSYDLNGDGKTNVWDLQLAFTQGKSPEDRAAALTEALGGQGDELHPNGEGVYEIWSRVGLTNLVENAGKGYSFKLMADLDLGGMDWTPIDNFRGTLDGNGKTISNFKVTKCGADKSMGFFSVVDYDDDRVQSVVKDLHLEDVEITATEDALYIGLLAGSNRGKIQDCTTVGVVNDARTVLPGGVYVGTIVGRNNNSVPDGTVSGSNSMTVLDTCTTYTHTQKVSSMMATNFATLSYPEGTAEDKQYTRHIGIAGYSKSTNIDTSLVWQDITNSSTLVSEALQERRETVARAMYDICTVEWTPTETMTLFWYKSDEAYKTSVYTKGKLYRGIPYNHGSSSLNRFNAWINDPDLPTEAYYLTDNNVIAAFNEGTPGSQVSVTTQLGKDLVAKVPQDWPGNLSATGTYVTGFARYVGNDCSSAATWAWRKVSASYGTDAANPNSTSNMFAVEKYLQGGSKSTGIIAVNGLVFDDSKGGTAYDIVNAAYEADKDLIPEALARASKGDFIMGYQEAGGHTRVLIGDAVAIRKWNGGLNNDLSYVITCEQGGGGSSGTNAQGVKWTSSWRADWKYTFKELVRYGSASDTTKCRYFPISCTAMKVEDTPAAYTAFNYQGGKAVTSNFHIEATVINGVTTYTRTSISGSRTRLCELDLTEVYPNIAKGDQVTIVLSNGQTYTVTYGTAYNQ